MEKNINISQTVEVGYDGKGNFKIINGPDMLPIVVVEQLLNMAAETTVQKLVAEDAKGITENIMSKAVVQDNYKALRLWKFISYASLIVICFLFAKLKGLI